MSLTPSSSHVDLARRQVDESVHDPITESPVRDEIRSNMLILFEQLVLAGCHPAVAQAAAAWCYRTTAIAILATAMAQSGSA